MGALKWRSYWLIAEFHQWVLKYFIRLHIVFALYPCNQPSHRERGSLLVCLTSLTTAPGCGLVTTGLRLRWCRCCSWFSSIFWFIPVTNPLHHQPDKSGMRARSQVQLKKSRQIFASFLHNKQRDNIWNTRHVFLFVFLFLGVQPFPSHPRVKQKLNLPKLDRIKKVSRGVETSASRSRCVD